MDQQIKKSLKTAWGKKAAQSRSIRSFSSAPIKEEMDNYERLFRQTIGKNKYPIVLVLGATPELRDLALKYNSITIAVDISQSMLEKMTEVMKNRNSQKNLYFKEDWFRLTKLFKPKTFDAVLSDASLNNIPVKRHEALVKSLHKILKDKGAVVTRNFIYLPQKPKDSIEKINDKYKKGRLNWLWILIHIGQYSKWQSKIYNPKTKVFLINQSLDLMAKLIEEKKLQYTKKDILRFNNLMKHAYYVSHISFPQKEWVKQVSKYFTVKQKAVVKKLEWTEYGPIWLLRKK